MEPLTIHSYSNTNYLSWIKGSAHERHFDWIDIGSDDRNHDYVDVYIP